MKRESDDAALRLTNNVHTLYVVRILSRKIWWRHVAVLLVVHSVAGLETENNRITLSSCTLCCNYFARRARLESCCLLRTCTGWPKNRATLFAHIFIKLSRVQWFKAKHINKCVSKTNTRHTGKQLILCATPPPLSKTTFRSLIVCLCLLDSRGRDRWLRQASRSTFSLELRPAKSQRRERYACGQSRLAYAWK